MYMCECVSVCLYVYVCECVLYRDIKICVSFYVFPVYFQIGVLYYNIHIHMHVCVCVCVCAHVRVLPRHVYQTKFVCRFRHWCILL